MSLLLPRVALSFGLLCAPDTFASTASTPPPNTANLAAAQLEPPPQRWALRLPNTAQVSFRGLASMDNAGGGTGAMLYPAPNAAVALVGLLTHGLLNSASRHREASRIQEAADKVVDPYRVTLNDFRHEALFELVAEQKRSLLAIRVAVPGEAPSGEWFLVIEPVFSLTQDQRALLLDSAFVLYAPDAPDKPLLQNAIRVVSAPVSGTDAPLFWLGANGQQMKITAAELMGVALDAIKFEAGKITANPDKDETKAGAHKSLRYFQGGVERIERAELVSAGCQRALLRTLRGGILSVPLSTTNDSIAAGRTGLGCEK